MEPQNIDQESYVAPYPLTDTLVPASGGKRFANFVIDYIAALVFVMIISASIGVFVSLLGFDVFEEEYPLVENLLGFFWYFGYYIFFEYALNGRTIGKMITRTRVLDEKGGKPGFGQVVGRTFARMIPFEAFSFLGDSSIGWHDSLPGTLVIDEKKSVLRSDWV
ncbi:RDD family protein [Cesiribacter sp. SM1]|uniref:RDD family protein n=1 Tax=Cesiribacter sp. SM1 TaxID=2861196 RepID=UPI001CD327DB|nr:RDD family protein [Cesiribacter sp. SM1]